MHAHAEPPVSRGPRQRGHEIASLDAFDRVAATGSLAGYHVQSLDLSDRTFALLGTDTKDSVFLGCVMEPDAAAKVRAGGALVFPPVPGLPFDPYRGALYAPDELYAGLLDTGYDGTPDARAYRWYQETKTTGDVVAGMLRSIHDDAVSDALDAHLDGARVVGVLGGHALERGSAAYAGAARLGRRLSREGLTVATGGGPGAMEAANLGAYTAPFEDPVLDAALALLSGTPHSTPSVTQWAHTAFDVLRRWPGGGPSLAMPTWFYGHEPPNAFASHIAKYFVNALREEGLLARSNAGLVFLPGAAGTVQEVFDAATLNYYRPHGEPTPMVLVDHRHWTETLPAWPLLQTLSTGHPMASRLTLVDSVDDVPEALARLTTEAPHTGEH
ncbi:Rossmann fold nucleotide-binding protein [Streptomyces sp. NRRL F-4489]|uniref:LOG family protein n=1 Tax=Streptomyces sp. NRRL F-4489 TaxID=1609095 RepID=UPI0007486038|nr:LOG family protein [Streptomyces sp. NRRL F-4489]KUL55177.1 Rossmann fold nucleotide-binding protein [Streptomyces sp. NRRL F-4489]